MLRRMRRLRLLRADDVAGLWWATRSLRTARRELDTASVNLRLNPPGTWARRISVPLLETFLRARNATCLERTLILQRLLAVHGHRYDVVLGVASQNGQVRAHAWIEGFDWSSAGDGYREITRITA